MAAKLLVLRNKEVVGDAIGKIGAAGEKVEQKPVQSMLEDIFDSAIVQSGMQHARSPLGFAGLPIRDSVQQGMDFVQTVMQRARHVVAQNEQFRDTPGRDLIAINFAVDLECRDRPQ